MLRWISIPIHAKTLRASDFPRGGIGDLFHQSPPGVTANYHRQRELEQRRKLSDQGVTALVPAQLTSQ